jgi:hypothetical protein
MYIVKQNLKFADTNQYLNWTVQLDPVEKQDG